MIYFTDEPTDPALVPAPEPEGELMFQGDPNYCVWCGCPGALFNECDACFAARQRLYYASLRKPA